MSEAQTNPSAADAAFDCSKLHVTIVDDSRHFRMILRAMLEGYGVRHIDEAAGAREALEMMWNGPPDILLTDILMPKFDGVELVGFIRNGASFPDRDMPIVCLSADTRKETILSAVRAGADGFLAKPVSIATLYRQIAQCITHPLPRITIGRYYGPHRRRNMVNLPLGH